MSPTMFVSVLLMLGGLGGAAASDLQVYGKSIQSDKTLLSGEDGGRIVRKQPYHQRRSETHRSLELESFNMQVTPTTGRISHPSIIKLYPPTAKPVQLHANMPMRFGRQNEHNDDRTPNSTPNMPQRFGRSSEGIRRCAKCPDVREAPNTALPLRLGRDPLYWSLLWPITSY